MMSKFREMKASKKGFTLMEILVAVVIIGIFGAVAASAVPGMIGKSHQRALVNQLATVQQAVDRYIAEEGVYPTTDLVKPAELTAPAAIEVTDAVGGLIEKGYLLNVNTKAGNFGLEKVTFGIAPDGTVFAVNAADVNGTTLAGLDGTTRKTSVLTAYDNDGGLKYDATANRIK